MALSKQDKQAVLTELSDLLSSSKMTVVASYRGTDVGAMQNLRRSARENNTKVKVIKNRLVIKALSSNDTFKNADTSALEGMLLYAFNGEDEVGAAQVLYQFSKEHPSIEFVGAYGADGTFVSADDVKSLARLPSKNALIAGIINTLNAPLKNIVAGIDGSLQSILQGLEAKAS